MAISVSHFLTSGLLHIDPTLVGVELLSAASIVDLSDEFRFDESRTRRATYSSLKAKRRKLSDVVIRIALHLKITQQTFGMHVDLTANFKHYALNYENDLSKTKLRCHN